ncbi:MAG: ShlB/FhaC/HecB family hemolysin secretion/activation protein, partial [Firmicutes bacterium]|nr:ShlB/FhaC/HecB family hemolysin secretion/activation protein [Bacillota bacterium]
MSPKFSPLGFFKKKPFAVILPVLILAAGLFHSASGYTAEAESGYTAEADVSGYTAEVASDHADEAETPSGRAAADERPSGHATEAETLERPGVIRIQKIVTGESQILTAEEIESITREYEGGWLTSNDLKRMINKLNRVYQQKGAITARAILPPQTVEDGVLRVELVEGRIGEIRVENNRFTKASYIQQRLTLEKGEIFYLNKLETELGQFNLANDIMLFAELQAGEEYQTTDVIIKTLEPPNFQAIFFTDNQGSEETGEYRAGLNLTRKSLFGYRDPITLSCVYSKGSLTASLDYQRPFRNRAYLQSGYNYSRTTIVKAGFETGDIGNTDNDFYVKYGKKRFTAEYEHDQYLSLQKKQTEARIATSIIEQTDLITAVYGI